MIAPIPQFQAQCSAEMARALGMRPVKRLDRPDLSFPVLERPTTHHALLRTEDGWFAWLWLIDRDHPYIETPHS